MNEIIQSMPAVLALHLYWYNVNPSVRFNDIYGSDASDAYRHEKIAAMCDVGLVRFFGELDTVHQYRVMAHAWKRYGAEASRRVNKELADPDTWSAVNADIASILED